MRVIPLFWQENPTAGLQSIRSYDWMSAPLAGKFQDHYQVLGIEGKADSDTIHRAYSQLAARFHPDNKHTADDTKFKAVNLAYEVLSDPVTRAAFDEVCSGPKQEAPFQFSGAEFFNSISRDVARRQALLCLLYDRRRSKPVSPGLTMRYVETILAGTLNEILLTVWYLKQKGWVDSDDRSNIVITVEGMESVERDPPQLDAVMRSLKAPAEPVLIEKSQPSDPVTPSLAELVAAMSPPQPEEKPAQAPPAESRAFKVGRRTITIPPRG